MLWDQKQKGYSNHSHSLLAMRNMKRFWRFVKYFVLKKNVIHERLKFHSQCQRHGASVEEFARNVHELVAQLEFRDKDDQISHRLLVGILDNELKVIPN